jgi:4-hydroxy-3-polyprenylbenzoate decarboxylase
MRIIVGITGASGSIYGVSLISALASMGVEVDVIASKMGERVLLYECGATLEDLAASHIYANDDLFADISSGSTFVDAVAVAPCSMSTISAIATGSAETLLTRVSAVALKEHRPLVVLAREMPFSTIALENLTKLSQAGACVMPASPGFYSRPTEIWELVSQVVCRIMDQLGVHIENPQGWKGIK